MTYDELLADIEKLNVIDGIFMKDALRAVVKLHRTQDITLPDGSWGENCCVCNNAWTYPCTTIQAIEKELQ